MPHIGAELMLIFKDLNSRKRWVAQFTSTMQWALLKAVVSGFTDVRGGLVVAINTLTGNWGKQSAWENIWEVLAKQPQLKAQDLINELLLTEKKETKSESAQSSELRSKPEALFAPYAGLVLLHPFLPAFFDFLGYLQQDRFVDKSIQERAIHLLYFLATGAEHPVEYELMIPKLLCGLELNAPIARQVDLEEKEKKEAVQLLESIIHQWPALEGSKPEDLRNSFLIRPGKLEYKEMGWQLWVEQMPYDLIFQHLPWGISPIMHSWMPGMLWVDWA